MTSRSIGYKRHRFPPAIIAHAVWLYFRFPLSLRLVEEMLLERGIVVSYETVRRWAMKFGRDYARRLKRKRASRRDIWHLDEVVVTIGGKQHWLWRAVDQDGCILDEIVQTRRDTEAAKRLLTRLLRKQGYPPRRMITDKLGSRSCQPSSIARTRASITGPRTLTCLCDDANGRCRAFDLREACSGSSPSSPPSAISSSLPVPVAPPLPPIFIASTPWRNGRPPPASPPESGRAAEIASPARPGQLM
jgi:putative transposase